MKRILHFTILLFASGLYAQNFEWLKTPDITLSMNPDMVSYSTACDPAGNVYYAGFKENAFPYSDILGDLFYNKYDANGNLLFSKTITGRAIIQNMISDKDGNIIIALGYNSHFTIDGLTITDPGQGMNYVMIKLDSSGNRLWHHQFSMVSGGFESVGEHRALTTDSNGNIYAGYGNYNGSRITKFTPDGTPQFNIDQENVRRITSIDSDELGNIYATGSCAEMLNANFNGTDMPSGMQYDTYVVKYSATGVYQWVKFVSDVTCPSPCLAVHSSSEIYFSSSLFGEPMFGSIPTEGNNQTSDFFVAKLNGNGDFQWVREVPGSGVAGHGNSNFVDTDTAGNVYFCGYMQGTINWGEGIVTNGLQPGRLSLLLQYSPSGNVLSATAAGHYGRADGIAISNGNVYMTGMGYEDGNFGNISYSGPHQSYYTYLTKIHFGTMGTDKPEASAVTLYPNPADGQFFIRGIVQNTRGSIVNMLGQQVMDFTVSAAPVDVSGLAKGAYFVRAAGYTTVKLIKN